MTQYCVELEPIEDYFFGNERSFGFGRDNKAIYNNYFITSESPLSVANLNKSL